uniref:Uncharacterized protein n=1 Tax=Glossina pallidipes TaxID=7398 RepID=A0A1A9Z3K6_GLOPL
MHNVFFLLLLYVPIGRSAQFLTIEPLNTPNKLVSHFHIIASKLSVICERVAKRVNESNFPKITIYSSGGQTDNVRRRAVIELSSFRPLPRLPKVPGRRNPMVDLAYSLSSKPVSPDLKRDNYSLHRLSQIVLAKQLRRFPSFLKVVQHNMTNMTTIIDKHFYNLKAEGFFHS